MQQQLNEHVCQAPKSSVCELYTSFSLGFKNRD